MDGLFTLCLAGMLLLLLILPLRASSTGITAQKACIKLIQVDRGKRGCVLAFHIVPFGFLPTSPTNGPLDYCPVLFRAVKNNRKAQGHYNCTLNYQILV